MMAVSALEVALFLFMFLIFKDVQAHVDQASFQLLSTEALEWQSSAKSFYDEFGGNEDEEDHYGSERRSLYWAPMPRHYCISYGALSANRVPCPPRSGRSYYTHNCYRARTPVNPYSRGCSCIAHCRR